MSVYNMKTIALALLLSRDSQRADAAMFGERMLGQAASRVGRGILNQERRQEHQHPTYTQHPDGLAAPFGPHPMFTPFDLSVSRQMYTPPDLSMRLPTRNFQRGLRAPEWTNTAAEVAAPAANWTRMPGSATESRVANEVEKSMVSALMNKSMTVGGTMSGFRSDARGRMFQGDVPNHLEVQEVNFLRNADSETAYQQFVANLTEKMSRERGADVDMGNGDDVPFTAATLPIHGPGAANPANEFVLYHGCSPAAAEAISKGNFDMNKMDPEGLFGPGVYMTDSVTKADEFALGPLGQVEDDWDAPRYMLLVKAALGKSRKFTTNDNFEEEDTQEALQTPPLVVKVGGANRNMDADSLKQYLPMRDWVSKPYQSVMGDKSHVRDAAGNMAHREWIVYNNQQVVPFAVITYRRARSE